MNNKYVSERRLQKRGGNLKNYLNSNNVFFKITLKKEENTIEEKSFCLFAIASHKLLC